MRLDSSQRWSLSLLMGLMLAVGCGADGVVDERDAEPVDPLASCVPPEGMAQNPRSVEEAMAWINAMDKPLTLPCFVASLYRPLVVNATSSRISLQPAAEERSPRLFLIDDPLVMSITLDGAASALLEFGERTQGWNSLKAEVAFPVVAPLTAEAPFTRIMYNDERTSCSLCHREEVELPGTVGAGGRRFVSRALRPAEWTRVDFGAVRAEHAACDPTLEPERCALLRAVFEYGEVRGDEFPEEMPTITD